jgi:uncharacterized protein (DUF2126 family)/transglutaminase-like putative cysteine protease
MSIHVALHHRTSYRYEHPVTLGPQVVRLRPAPHARTRILGYTLKVTPEQHFLNWQQDPQSNYLARLVFPEKTKEFSIEVEVVAEMAVFNPFDFFLEPEGEHYPFKYDAASDQELAPFLKCQPFTPLFQAYLADLRHEILGTGGLPHVPGTHSETATDIHAHAVLPEAGQLKKDADKRLRTIDLLVAVNQRLWKDIRYTIRMEPGVQTPEKTLDLLSGSCRDSAWLMVQVMRRLGIAARFVSGYLIQLKSDVKSLDGPSGTEVDFTDLHAWCEVYLPGAGWVGLDPTSGLLAGEGHIPLAASPEPQSAAPISGVVEPCKTEFEFEMRVDRIYESPRVTKPYTEDQWAEIAALGHALDKELVANDVRLTMGGEPTFVSIDDVDGAEWNTTAVGPNKAKLSDELLKRLKDRFSTGAFLHYGQGKWYPGEPLPRWSYGCHWRKDGQPLWEHPHLFADMKTDYGVTEVHSARFIHALSERLGCGGKWIMPAYEDAFYHLWRERKLPVNVDPLKSNLKEKEERERLAKIFEQGLDKIVGHVLPLKSVPNGWETGPWFLRTEHCYLLPGDSPIGLRLPLDSQPWVKTTDYPYLHEQDPMQERDPLPSRQKFVRGIAGIPPSFWKRIAQRRGPLGLEELIGEEAPKDLIDPAQQPPALGQSADKIVRTALCVQPRDGKLFIFMPPTQTLEEYLSCLGAVEDVALALDQPIVIEGYSPPYDPRVHTLKVTPDPGVIEVNVQPAKSWDEMVNITETLYEEARLTRLGTEKFMVDGRHTGTGGGNHIVIGAETPKDSPFLRRPDLLRSLVSYWQNHPALSFLFSGLFIGPTSQSPRIDEARNDSLYELEVAFKAASESGHVPPWLVDRLYRNLLIDSTGNTHRSEFCIDKLYSPDSSTGRLGLVEMRAFEMPPHAHMSLAQALMLRTLIARFWKQPYEAPLVRWGTAIHDRWMLPHFVWSDLEDVCHDTKLAGYELKSEWFAPHHEFRFPISGDWTGRNVHVEIRQALEPWHVLGEEGSAGGAVRYVDSSSERIQIKAQGLVEGRYAITCNGKTVPLHPTGTNGEYVAGVRYRAWQPESCLHPTIGVHSPLTIDLVDLWNQRSLGGCTYHVVHPGGLSYDTFPVNSYEAESRRLSRFFRHGHTPGIMKVAPAVPNPEFPFTLDLRLG